MLVIWLTEERLIASPRLSPGELRQCDAYGIKTADPHTTWARHRPECRGTCCPVHAGAFVGPVRTPRRRGSRPAGWRGRGPALLGGLGRGAASPPAQRA